MNTTENQTAETPKKLEKDDKAMKDAYNKGETINDIANRYGLTEAEVTAVVVTEVKTSTLPTQAELDAQETKKGK